MFACRRRAPDNFGSVGMLFGRSIAELALHGPLESLTEAAMVHQSLAPYGRPTISGIRDIAVYLFARSVANENLDSATSQGSQGRIRTFFLTS